MSEKLKPCPFCGGEAESTKDGRCWQIECTDIGCPVGPSTYWYNTEEEAVKAWNTRAERTCRMDIFAVHDDGTITYQCSECGRGYCIDDRPPSYCPSCGAKVVK